MDQALLIGPLAIAVMLLLAGLGVPVGFALGIVGSIGLWMTGGFNFMIVTLESMPYDFMHNYAFVVLPMFILMGLIASSAGVVTELYTAAYRWTSGIRGGLLITTVLSAAGFGAISGSTVVSAAIFTRIALPEMIRFGYHIGIGAGAIAGAGTLAALIPPSLSFVIYGFLTGESIGQLLIAGVIPGLTTTAVFIVGIVIMVWIKPEWAPKTTERFSLAERLHILVALWPTILLVTIVLGGIYTGFMPPSAAGSVGAVGAVLIALMRRRLTVKIVRESLQQTAIMASVLVMIIIGGILLARFLTLAGFLDALLDFVNDIGLNRYSLITFVIFLFLLLGMFVDTLSIWVISVPVLHPLALSLDINPLWFAVFIVKLSEIGVISPPVGLNLFSVMSASEGRLKIGELYLGILPFIAMEVVMVFLLLIFPSLVTWLPQQMIR